MDDGYGEQCHILNGILKYQIKIGYGEGEYMNVELVAFSIRDGKIYSWADINVDGLGVVKIKTCLSDETILQICKEVEVVLRNKMGQEGMN